MNPQFDVVIYGGGHAGAMVAKQISYGAKVALVDTNDFFEVCSSTVRSLVEPEFGNQGTFLLKDALPNTKLIQGQLTTLDPNGTGEVLTISNEKIKLQAKVVLLATGSRYATKASRSTGITTRKDRMDFYNDFAERVKNAQTIMIAGGGPIGVEFAGEVLDKYKKTKQITIVNSASRLLPTTTEKASHIATEFLKSHGVEILNDTTLTSNNTSKPFEPGTATLSNGQTVSYDLLLQATGGTPTSEYMDAHWSDVLNERKEICVAPNFRVKNSNVFAMGDVAALNEPKLAWLVGEQIRVAVHNVRAALADNPSSFSEYGTHPNDKRIGITLGKDHGVLQIPYIGTISWGWFVRMAKSRTMMVPKFRKELGVN